MVTLVHKNLACDVSKQSHDSEGRWSKPVLQIANQTLTIYNVYGPNGENKSFFNALGTLLQADPSTYKIVGGDFNEVLDRIEDRRGPRD